MENRELRIAHFSFKDDYGAMGAAYELHKTLLQKGLKSTFFVREKTRDDDSIVELGYGCSIEERLHRSINRLYFEQNRRNIGTAPINFDCWGIQWDKDIEDRLRAYDILHIHWVACFLSMDNIYQISKLGKPVVWTMHDFHPFTGGCHCPEMCRKYEEDCLECDALKNNYLNITQSILLEKQYKYPKSIQIVTASVWLKEIVARSRVFQNNPCEVIPIGIDVECFIPQDKCKMKQKIGLSPDTKVILVGAQSISQNVKGYIHLKKVLDILKDDLYCRNLIQSKKLVLLIFGYADGTENYGGIIPIINMGFIEDRERLCEIYNAADVFIFPSVQDTFGMTATEAMSCGVPTIAFDVGAMSNVIRSGVNGYKVKINDYSAMASNVIQIVKENPIDAEACRKRIVDFYSLECETEKMLQLYQTLIKNSTVADAEKEEPQKNDELERFVYQCTYEILMGIAPNQYMNTTIQNILLEYSPEFLTPEQKVKKLVERKIFDDKKDIVIYGAGDYGRKTLKELEKYRIHIQGFWDFDERKMGQLIEGHPIWKPIKKEEPNEKVIIVAGMNYVDMIKCLMYLGYLYCEDFY